MSGTATIGTDYTLSGAQVNGNLGGVTIPAGQSSAIVILHVVTDGITEGIESVKLTLRNGSGYRVSSPSRAMVRISDP
jgi:hypothetical protein